MSNDIQALRNVLFDTLKGLKAGTVPVDRAKAINETSQTIINTARLELDFMRHNKATRGTGFVPLPEGDPAAPGGSPNPGPALATEETRTGVLTRTASGSTHRIRG